MILVLRHIIPKGFLGITLYPFVFLKHKEQKKDEIFLNHEQIHLKQQIELLIVFFYLWYGIEFLIRLIQYGNRRKAYFNVSFEKEAYSNEINLEYIKKRPKWAFLKYLLK
ncbi:hypothetical protein [Pseudofulvibacter geojedonensis]|uniref:DUF4157 domain-containing protein n=1 Tax=Pseudofulvibacter geojedonensis TaxID=1123758 RepID=A0ABW3I209_9FLAO